MSGAWEIASANQVLVAILHTDLTSIAWSLGFRKLIVPGQVTLLAGMPYDMGRNTACVQALMGGFQFVYFLDSDVIPPPDAILRLMAHRQPIVSGVYYRRSPPHGIPVMIREQRWVTQFPANSLIEVDYVGAGCLLIRRDVLEAMPPQDEKAGKRWFHWKVDQAHSLPQGHALSEDFAFCQHAKSTLGVKTLVDTGIQCRHIGLGESVPGAMIPCNAMA